jgi:hypothetical protein
MSKTTRLDRIGRAVAVVAAMTAFASIASAVLVTRTCTNGCTGSVQCATSEDACCCKPRTGTTWTCSCKTTENCKDTPTDLCK